MAFRHGLASKGLARLPDLSVISLVSCTNLSSRCAASALFASRSQLLESFDFTVYVYKEVCVTLIFQNVSP
jgi:hypothetical protein